MKLRIGIGMNFRSTEEGVDRAYLDSSYFDVPAGLGVMPIPIVPTENIVLLDAILGQLDGVVLTGGLDMDSALWDEPLHEEAELVHQRRQRFDFLLYEQAQKHQLPLLAICLGIQVVNVAHGGGICQHIPDLEGEIDHGGGDSGTTYHEVELNRDSHLRKWFRAEKITVPSAHHQGVDRLGEGLRAAAVAEDGIVEAIERLDYPDYFLAVQWHPEREIDKPDCRLLFDKFFAAAAK